jgi:hypothetical protein
MQFPPEMKTGRAKDKNGLRGRVLQNTLKILISTNFYNGGA